MFLVKTKIPLDFGVHSGADWWYMMNMALWTYGCGSLEVWKLQAKHTHVTDYQYDRVQLAHVPQREFVTNSRSIAGFPCCVWRDPKNSLQHQLFSLARWFFLENKPPPVLPVVYCTVFAITSTKLVLKRRKYIWARSLGNADCQKKKLKQTKMCKYNLVCQESVS